MNIDDTFETKTVAAALKAVDSDDPNGEFEAVLSTETEDRDGEVIAQGAFEPLPKSIPFFYQHDWMKGATPVGRGRPFYDGGKLKVRGKFASSARAQEIRSLVNEGVIDAMSVGFLNAERDRDQKGRPVVRKGDLFESSFTAIPVNRTALITASKSVEDPDEVVAKVTALAVKSAGQDDRLQQIHDMLVDHGATCKTVTDVKAAVQPHSTVTSDAAWDSSAAKARLSNDDGADTYRKAYAWQDPDGDPDTKAAWRFIHHEVAEDGSVGAANIQAATTGIGVLNGGRGVDPSDQPWGDDREGIHAHLARHLRDVDREPPELRSINTSDVKSESGEAVPDDEAAAVQAAAESPARDVSELALARVNASRARAQLLLDE